ncbi:TIGR02530 family flagellar biosynthesis protein [Thalassobacillus hwangdonensis]|uniref:TIGR02530 family flagellar biosynthesis protein n=1 Tax=Thalassobacillus hwangdonensis TaxID=546108 RepID=A0ABW3KWE1_9BACI
MDPRIHHLQQTGNLQPLHHREKVSKTGTSFKEVLNEVQQLKISKHAEQRIKSRGITITDEQWRGITNKINEAKTKGIKDPLVVLDQAALVVSAKNNTVVTAMDRKEATSQIFTNIDGTILIEG